MTHVSAQTATQLDVLRTGSFAADVYMLIWEQEIIFQAQINQASFESSFAHVTYDNVTVGAYTDIKSDFICYIDSTAGNIRTAQHRFRVRADGSGNVATASVLNINETSAALTDNLYIMVVKDVGCEAKVPKTITADDPIDYDYARDYAITFRRLLGSIYGLQSVYVGVLNSDGVYDFEWTAQALIGDTDASADTWLWDIDGLSYQSGTSADASITARATSAGQYMPRITHTDDQGQTWYFTFKVFVIPADYSSTLNLSFSNWAITSDLVNGLTLNVQAGLVDFRDMIQRIDWIPDLSFCAVWVDTRQPIPSGDIAFCGWFLSESIQNTFTSEGNRLLNTSFQAEGIAGRMSDTISRRIHMIEASSPATFGDIKTLTPWRAILYFLTEHTTVPNIAAVSFSDTSDDYQYPRFGSADSSVLGSVTDLLFTINGNVEYARSGEIYLDRLAWMLPDAGRNALDTVANWTTSDMATSASGGLLFSISRGMVPRIGREMGGGGIYNTTTTDIQVLKAVTPSVAQSQGNQLTTFNRQVLAADSDINTGAAELGQRNADDMEARNPQTVMQVTFPAPYWYLTAHAGQWHTWTIEKTDNNRGISYDTGTRWVLRQVTNSFLMASGIWATTGQFQQETQGTSFQTLVTMPLEGAVQYYNPVLPRAPTYTAYPEDPTSQYPDPSNITPEDEPPFTPEDQAMFSRPQDPAITVGQVSSGGIEGLCWDASQLWKVTAIPTNPVFTDVTPSGSLGTISNGKFDPFGKRALCLSNDGTDTVVHKTVAFGDLVWTDLDVLGTVYEKILYTRIIDRAYAVAWREADPWTFSFVFEVDDYWTPNDEGGGDRGVYTPPWDAVLVNESGNRSVILQVYYEFTSSTITSVTATYDFEAGEDSTGPTGENCKITLWTSGFKDTVVDTASQTSDDGSDLEFAWTGSETVDAIDVRLRASYKVGSTPSPQGSASLKIVTITGTGTNPFGGVVASIFSTDHFSSYEAEVSVGDLTTTPGGAETQKVSAATKIYMAIDDEIKSAVNGGAYSSQDDGGSAGTYAKSIVAFTGGDNFVYGTAVAFGGETLFVVDTEVLTAITPNDGANDGIVTTSEGLAMWYRSSQHIVGLFDFSGTVKMAYSADQGTTWKFNTQVTNDASYIRMKCVGGVYHIVIADADAIWWGQWDGTTASTITLYEKTAPSTALLGIELK